jgi:hypothetical protein
MKALIALALTFSLGAVAAPSKTLPKKTTASVETSATTLQTSRAVTTRASDNWVMKRLSVGGILAQADTFKGPDLKNAFINGRVVNAGADINSEAAKGLMVQLTEFSKWSGFGWYTALSMETSREFSSFKAGGVTGTFADKPRHMPWMVYGGGNYKFNQAFYLMGGLNYTIYSEKKAGGLDSFDMTPEFGYQFGAGVNFKKVSIEIAQREAVYNMTAKSGNAKLEGRTTLSGLNLQARYNF